MTRALFLAVALVAAPAAQAQQVDCNNASSQAALNICSAQAARRADDELNRLWRIVKPNADARGQGDALLAEQRAWLKRRDRRCEAERASFGQGSFAPAAYAMCIEKMTKKRNRQLRKLQ